MSIFAASVLVNCILLAVVLWFQVRAIRRMVRHLWETWQTHRPRRWKPQSPHDCPHCQGGVELQLIRTKTDLRPYSERKSRRGRKKCVSTGGFACPNARCTYYGITDETIHALVGYGRDNGIQRLKCQVYDSSALNIKMIR